MGQWGFYDDEGDTIAISFQKLKKKVLPKKLQKCYRFDQIVKIPCYQIHDDKEKEKLVKK